MDMSQEPFCVEIYRNRTLIPGRTLRVKFYREKTHMEMSQEFVIIVSFGS